MQLLLPIDVVRNMRRHLFRAGRREIGGIVMGEDLGNQRFRHSARLSIVSRWFR